MGSVNEGQQPSLDKIILKGRQPIFSSRTTGNIDKGQPILGDMVRLTVGNDQQPALRCSVGPMLGNITDGHQPTMGDIVKSQPTLGDIVKDRQPTLGDIAKGRQPTLGDIVKDRQPTLGDIAKGHQPTLGDIVKDRQPTLGDIAKGRQPTLGDIVKDRQPTLGDIAKGHQPTLGDIVKDRQPTLGDIAKGHQPTLGDIVKSQPTLGDIAKGRQPTLGDIVKDRQPTLGDIAKGHQPTLGDIVKDRQPTLGDIAKGHQPTLGDIAKGRQPTLGDVVKDHQPTLGDIISKGTLISSVSSTNTNTINSSIQSPVAQSSNTNRSLSYLPTLGDIISQNISTSSSDQPMLCSNSDVSMVTPVAKDTDEPSTNQNASFDQSSLVVTVPLSQQSTLNRSDSTWQDDLSLKTSVPPGVPSQRQHHQMEENSFTNQSLWHNLTESNSDPQPLENLFLSRPKVHVSCSKCTSSMVGVVLANDDHNDYKSSVAMQKCKKIALKRINNKLFSGKRFTFSTPSPDDYIFEKQKKAFNLS